MLMIFIDLIYNLALLIALSVVSGFIGHRWKLAMRGALLQGLVFGGAAVIGMLRPLILAPGLIFDGRSVMISLCGLFFGPAAVTVAAGMALICRVLQGGMGVVMGVCVILSSALTGLTFHYRRVPRDGEISAIHLLGFGLLVHIIMVLLIFTLPVDIIRSTLSRITLPVLLTYPLATVLVGKILSDQQAGDRSRKEMEMERERFRTLVNSAPFGMVLISGDGRFLLFNDKFRDWFGYEAADLPNGKEWFRKAFPDREERHNAIAAWISDDRAAPAGAGRSRIFTVTGKGGDKKTIRFIPVRLSNGDQLVTLEDITRDLELEKRFRQTERLESVGRLAAGVAHDLNNLLSPILGNAELLLLDMPEASKVHRQVRDIKQAAERSRDLIGQLLAFGRKQVMEMRILNLCRIVGDMEKLIQRTLRENIKMDIFPCTHPCLVSADAGQIGQILMNLCVNAQDAMPDGGALSIEIVMVRLEETVQGATVRIPAGDYVTLTVSDTGCGMDPEIQQHIFEPFFTTKNDLGTGLGLATVYGIVQQHGGHISVYSEPGEGTTFKIYLPASREKTEMPNSRPSDAKYPVGSETILLVEDNDMTREAAEGMLVRLGYTVLTASCGNRAMDLFNRHPGRVDLLMTDVVMPDMDGKTLFQKISGIRPEMKALFMSGYTQNIIAHHGVLESGIHFIQKPFSIQALAAKVREALGKTAALHGTDP